jgi:hypothetical protein
MKKMKKLEAGNRRVKHQLRVQRETILLLTRSQLEVAAGGSNKPTSCSSGDITCTED